MNLIINLIQMLTLILVLYQSRILFAQDLYSQFKYASHVFKPGSDKPVTPINRAAIDENHHELINEFTLVIEEAVMEGDILQRKDGGEKVLKRAKRKIINEFNKQTGETTRWLNGVVPYEMDSLFPSDRKQLVFKAFEHWQNHTCIRFEPYDTVKHNNYRSILSFVNATICGSFIGYNVDKTEKVHKSMVYLGKDCLLGNVIHELGHTVGYLHEHSRVDRDEHIKINFSKIEPGIQGQYYKVQNGQPGYFGIPYDLGSIMHYGSSGGVITALDPNRAFLMGQRTSLSFLDIKMANLAYKCNAKCEVKLECRNGGFMDQQCECFCPEGLTGVHCDEVITNIQNGETALTLDQVRTGLNCNFDNDDLCMWSNDQARGFEEWTVNNPEYQGLTETQFFFKKLSSGFRTGPQNSTLNGKNDSRYVYLNSLRKTTENSNGILTSPQIKVSQPTKVCIKFWYNMYHHTTTTTSKYPLKIGNLSVNLRYSTGSHKTIWMKEGNQGADWKAVHAEFDLQPPVTAIYFEGTFDEHNYGDMALGNIEFKRGMCKNNPVLTEWSSWSECSTSCGKGLKTRQRKCVDSGDRRELTSVSCNGVLAETQICIQPECRAPTWSNWTEWSTCASGCDSYTYRVRKCLNQDLGSCKGESTEYKACMNCRQNRKPSPPLLKQQQVSLDNIASFLAKIRKQQTSQNNTTKLSITSRQLFGSGSGNSGLEKSLRNVTTQNYVKQSLNSTTSTTISHSITYCGGQFTFENDTSVFINSPNYPGQYPVNIRCTYLIRSPENTKISVKFIDLDMEQTKRDSCVDGIELRYYHLGQPGPIFCGTVAQSSQIEMKTYSNFLMIILRSDWAQTRTRRGFNLQLETTTD